VASKVLAHLITAQELLRNLAIFDRASINCVVVVTSTKVRSDFIGTIECFSAIDSRATMAFLGLVLEHMSVELVLAWKSFLLFSATT
jgi:hypothetical protein